MRRLNDIINDVDAEIAGMLGREKTASADVPAEEDIFKLAESLTATSTQMPPQQLSEPGLTLQEKVAHAVAICETLMNLPVILEMQAFEKAAAEKGFTEEQIAEFLEKKAAGKYRALKVLGALGAGGAAVAGGHAAGKKQGRDAAYKDVAEALSEYHGY